MALAYISGFGNHVETEAVPGALPIGRNSPQRVKHGLYAEQLSGSAFTAPRASNRRSWLYRLRPSVKHSGRFTPIDRHYLRAAPDRDETHLPIGALRWNPAAVPITPLAFVSGLHTVTTCGDVEQQRGIAVHLLLVNTSMRDSYFQNADGEMLVVAQHGTLRFCTEFGVIEIEPGEICIIPRGVIIRLELPQGPARAYICENYGLPFQLPERGPIGANGLANERDFLMPVAAFEDRETASELIVKFAGGLHRCQLDHSPLDVVAWHGNHAPYKYDLRRFSPMNAVLTDHPDPSIFTVLTSASGVPGTANVDFVIFPERWSVAEDTFRPPWFHRNIMSEFMGLIYGTYDAKPNGFVPGGMSLHNMMMPHGPDAEAFEKASNASLSPAKLAGTLAFMFETRLAQRVTRYAAEHEARQDDYLDCWRDIKKQFGPG
ncbi:MAG TPA: homogentisate 1,2-dioxygenase [Dongiaceae bacterium]|nr:homogentisate 1,2-dioxygenase [Dongiaceae bacterium]